LLRGPCNLAVRHGVRAGQSGCGCSLSLWAAAQWRAQELCGRQLCGRAALCRWLQIIADVKAQIVLWANMPQYEVEALIAELDPSGFIKHKLYTEQITSGVVTIVQRSVHAPTPPPQTER